MATGDVRMPCHLTVDYESSTWEEDQGKAPQCAGRSAMNANSGRLPRDPSILVVPKDPECFGHITEFMTAHRVFVKRTVFEMAMELNTLGDLVGKLPKPMFGGDHDVTVRAQMEVLRDNLDEDDIYEQFAESDEDDDEPSDMGPDNFEQIEEILEMRRWLDGEQDKAPSEGWQELRIT